jgi:hypothetical protein
MRLTQRFAYRYQYIAKMKFWLSRIIGRIIGEAALPAGGGGAAAGESPRARLSSVKEEKGNEWVNPC